MPNVKRKTSLDILRGPGSRLNKFIHEIMPGTRVRIYHSKSGMDEWTAVVFGHEWNEPGGMHTMIAMSNNPNHPQGISQFTSGVDGPHLGKKIPWDDVPLHIRQHVISRLS